MTTTVGNMLTAAFQGLCAERDATWGPGLNRGYYRGLNNKNRVWGSFFNVIMIRNSQNGLGNY